MIITEWCIVLTIFFIQIAGVNVNQNVNTFRMAGYCKAAITFVKYMPQVIIRHQSLGLLELEKEKHSWMVSI